MPYQPFVPRKLWRNVSLQDFRCNEESLFSHRRESLKSLEQSHFVRSIARVGARVATFLHLREIFGSSIGVCRQSYACTSVCRPRARLYSREAAARPETNGWNGRRAQAEGGRMRVMGARSHKTATTDTGSCSPSVPYSPRLAPSSPPHSQLGLTSPFLPHSPSLSPAFLAVPPGRPYTKIPSFCARPLPFSFLDRRSIVTKISYGRLRYSVYLFVNFSSYLLYVFLA